VRDIQKVKAAILKSYALYHLAIDTGMAVSASPAVSGQVRIQLVSKRA